jgi:hypothetical protein
MLASQPGCLSSVHPLSSACITCTDTTVITSLLSTCVSISTSLLHTMFGVLGAHCMDSQKAFWGVLGLLHVTGLCMAHVHFC